MTRPVENPSAPRYVPGRDELRPAFLDMTRIGHYEVIDELPPGSTGRAFLVDNGTGDRGQGVLKVLDAPQILSTRFITMLAAERISALAYRHMFSARIHDIDIRPERVQIVSEMVDGMPLSSLLSRVRAMGEQLPWDVVISFGVQLAWALQSAHARPWQPETRDGLYHGRICPDAVYVTYDGYPRILGIGLGRSRRCLPPSRQSLPYLAPEMWETKGLTARADIYGLGVLLYDTLRAKRTFDRETIDEVRQAVAVEEPPSLRLERPDIPRSVEDVLRAMTHKVPSDRPRDIGAVSALLKGCLPDRDALYPPRLAAVMEEHFADRAELSRRDRCLLRRRLGVSGAGGGPPTLPGLVDDPATSEDLADFIDRLAPSRRILEEAPPTPIEPMATPRRAFDPVTVPAPAPNDASLASLDAGDASDGDMDRLVNAIVMANQAPGARRPTPPSQPHHTATATFFAAQVSSEPPTPDLFVAAAITSAPSAAVTLPPFPTPPPRTPPAQGPLASSVLAPVEADTELGALINDRYQIMDVLGQGAAAIVYRAEHVQLKKSFAVKVLRPELSLFPSVVERFRREARAVSQLDHPNVVSVSDFGQTENGSLYLVMPLIDGVTLHRLLEQGGPLDPRTAIDVAMSALAGLEYAHERGLVHRDLKPDNLMVENDGGRMQAKLLDFGIAKSAEVPDGMRITQTGMVPGTPAYMAPEQAAGEPVDARSDLYALGVVLYESLSGRLPFMGKSMVELLMKVMTKDPEPLDLVPHSDVRTDQLVRVVAQAMEKESTARFQSARLFSEALRNCIIGP